MNTSSYNLLKAAADGLAEAIRYRTNLKRRRREEEYNYNRDWQRNENEYQRDLGRKRDELDYMTDYNWKQEQRAYDRGIERKNQEREANKARILDFVDTYNPANVNRHDWADVQNFNTNAIANDIPLSIKYEDLEKLNKSLKDKMAVLKQQHDYKMAEIAANRMGRGGSVRQPRALSEIEAYAKNPELMKSFWEAKYGVRGGSPKAVKGSGSKSVAVGGSGFGKEAENALNNYYKMVGELADAQSKASGKGNVDSVQKMLDINPELPEEQRALLEGTIQTDQAHQNRQLADSLKNYRDRVEIARQRANEYLKPYGRMINQNGQMVNIMEAKKNNISSIVSEDDDILGDIESRNPQLARGNVVSLYSDGTQPTGVFSPDVMPSSVSISTNTPYIGSGTNRLYVNPNVFKHLPNNSYAYK